MNIDITKSELTITQLQHVLHSRMSPKRIHHTEGRPWDGLCYILNGCCHYTFSDGSALTTTRGCLLYLAKDALYNMHVEEGPYESIYVDFLFDAPQPRQSAVLLPRDAEETENRFHRLLQRFSHKTPGYRSDCLSILYRIYGALQASNAPQYLPLSSRHRMESACAFIGEHLSDEALSVKALAQQAGISEVQFRKLFQAACGSTPIAYIIEKRLAHAKELMRYSDLSLEEIALQSGFSSLSYFCRVFKKQTSQTPGQYRSQWTRESL